MICSYRLETNIPLLDIFNEYWTDTEVWRTKGQLWWTWYCLVRNVQFDFGSEGLLYIAKVWNYGPWNHAISVFTNGSKTETDDLDTFLSLRLPKMWTFFQVKIYAINGATKEIIQFSFCIFIVDKYMACNGAQTPFVADDNKIDDWTLRTISTSTPVEYQVCFGLKGR